MVYRFRLQRGILKQPLTKTISIWITKAGFVVKIIIFSPGLQFQTSLGLSPMEFSGVGFDMNSASMISLTFCFYKSGR